MSEAMVITCFAVLLAMVATWFILVSWLFSRLRNRHAVIYETMGSPSLFWNSSPRNNWLFLKFIFSSQWRTLGDPAVAKAVRFMRIFLVFYTCFFLSFVGFFFLLGFPQK
jgi:hypothetical protein